TPIQIVTGTSLPGVGPGPSGIAVQLLPDGQTFATDVELSVRVPASGSAVRGYVTYEFIPSTPFAMFLSNTYDESASTVTTKLRHFSWYWNFKIALPVLPFTTVTYGLTDTPSRC